MHVCAWPGSVMHLCIGSFADGCGLVYGDDAILVENDTNHDEAMV